MTGHHHHHHIDPEAGDARVFWAVVINLVLTLAQIIGGALSGSLALIADAIHNLSDAISLAIACLARKIARRGPDGDMTFGYGRAEIAAALINYTTLIVIGLYLVYQAILRFFAPADVDGWLVVIIAGLALIIDLGTAALTFSLSKTSMNIRAAFLHNVADSLGSVAVIIAGTLILLYDWRLADPLVTLLIAGYILWLSFAEIGAVIRIVMLGSPPGLDTAEVLKSMGDVDGVANIHHLHLWQVHEHEVALDAHLVVAQGEWARGDAIKNAVKKMLRESYDIAQATLEIECTRHACGDAQAIGHASMDAAMPQNAHRH
jgi:cobalt-zinc-cadmium efflux system protein